LGLKTRKAEPKTVIGILNSNNQNFRHGES